MIGRRKEPGQGGKVIKIPFGGAEFMAASGTNPACQPTRLVGQFFIAVFQWRTLALGQIQQPSTVCASVSVPRQAQAPTYRGVDEFTCAQIHAELQIPSMHMHHARICWRLWPYRSLTGSNFLFSFCGRPVGALLRDGSCSQRICGQTFSQHPLLAGTHLAAPS